MYTITSSCLLSVHMKQIIIMIITKHFEKEIIRELLLHLHVIIFFHTLQNNSTAH